MWLLALNIHRTSNNQWSILVVSKGKRVKVSINKQWSNTRQLSHLHATQEIQKTMKHQIQKTWTKLRFRLPYIIVLINSDIERRLPGTRLAWALKVQDGFWLRSAKVDLDYKKSRSIKEIDSKGSGQRVLCLGLYQQEGKEIHGHTSKENCS